MTTSTAVAWLGNARHPHGGHAGRVHRVERFVKGLAGSDAEGVDEPIGLPGHDIVVGKDELAGDEAPQDPSSGPEPARTVS
jgi:hypothetical protein